MTARLLAIPPSPRTAHSIACRLRSAGFYSLPNRIWNDAADLADLLTTEAPTVSQRIWLWSTFQKFLNEKLQQ